MNRARRGMRKLKSLPKPPEDSIELYELYYAGHILAMLASAADYQLSHGEGARNLPGKRSPPPLRWPLDVLADSGTPSWLKPCGCHNSRVDLKGHEVAFDMDWPAESSPVREVRRFQCQIISANAPRSRQPQRDVPGHHDPDDLREPDPGGGRQTKPCCMACRRPGVRIPLAPP